MMSTKIKLIFSILIATSYQFYQENIEEVQQLYTPEPQEYNPDLGIDFLYYSKAAYCEEEDLTSWNCGSTCEFHKNMTDVHVITNVSYQSQLYIGYDKSQNLTVVSFRGSSNLRNWLSDLHSHRINYPYCGKCLIHAGFWNVYQASEEEMFEVYHKIQNKYRDRENNKLLITGHSLGGALANIAAMEFRRKFIVPDYVYAFASPRIGNKRLTEFASVILPNLIQVIRYKDPVPHLPAMVQGFVRFPTEAWYYDSDDEDLWQWCVCPVGEENPDCSDQYYLYTNINDHLNYLGHYTGCGEFDEKQQEYQQIVQGVQLNHYDQYTYVPDEVLE